MKIYYTRKVDDNLNYLLLKNNDGAVDGGITRFRCEECFCN